MKQTRRLTNGLVACAVAFAMVSSLAAQTATEGTAKVVRIKGPARFSTGNNVWQPLKVGAVLSPGTSSRPAQNRVLTWISFSATEMLRCPPLLPTNQPFRDNTTFAYPKNVVSLEDFDKAIVHLADLPNGKYVWKPCYGRKCWGVALIEKNNDQFKVFPSEEPLSLQNTILELIRIKRYQFRLLVRLKSTVNGLPRNGYIPTNDFTGSPMINAARPLFVYVVEARFILWCYHQHISNLLEYPRQGGDIENTYGLILMV